MNRKYLALGLCVILSLSACGGQKATQEPQQEPDQKVVQQTETTPDLVQVKAETPVRPEAPAEENAVDEAAPVEEVTPVEEVETVDLFTSCEETVYATGEVNIRASWTSSSDKLGSLARGDSVTRTGNSITGTEAENWSRVQLSDGSTAYINNNYLSLTKPAVQQATTGGTGGGTATDGGSGSSKATQQITADGFDPETGLAGWTQDANGNWHMGSHNTDTSAPAASQPTGPVSNHGTPTDEEQNAGSETARRIYAGEEKLKFDEELGIYYYE